MKPRTSVKSGPKGELNIASIADSIDLGIETLYKDFLIEQKNISKSDISVSGMTIPRRLYKVSVPPTFIPLLFNQKLNILTMRFGGKAFGSENSKTKSVMMYTQIGKDTTHSISIRPLKEQRKAPKRTKKRK
jgi:hypothetical protein